MERITSTNAPKAVGSYSVGTEHEGVLYLSGALPINPVTGAIEGSDVGSQVRQSMKNIKAILEDNYSGMNQIIKSTIYLNSIADFSAFDAVYKTFFEESYPSRSAYEVGNLPMGALVEIEIIAVSEKE